MSLRYVSYMYKCITTNHMYLFQQLVGYMLDYTVYIHKINTMKTISDTKK